MKLLKRIRKFLKRFIFVLGLVIFLFMTLELIWRFQWIDFYEKELVALNPDLDRSISGDQSPVLFFGDSFSAQTDGYIQKLRNQFPEEKMINCAIPGTGIKETLAIADGRLNEFKPKVVIYQIYVGNDLFDIRHPEKLFKTSWVRNMYWTITDYFKSIAWMNYASGQILHQTGIASPGKAPEPEDVFNKNAYSERVKRIIRAEPGLYGNSVLLKGKRAEDMDELLEGIEKLYEKCMEAGAELKLFIIPHCIQVDQTYRLNYLEIGTPVIPPKSLKALNYPFLLKIQERFPELTVINPLGEMQVAELNQQNLYFANDPHLNEKGQDLIARVLAPILE